MKKELDDKLCENYPLIFSGRHKSMMETCMCLGFECGDGWYNIIDQLCASIQSHIDWKNQQRERLLESNPYNIEIPKEMPQVVATQVKEKFGTLRFYYDGGDDIIDGMVRMAESMSYVTCEVCGNPGKSNSHGWISTLCNTHREKTNES
jgi:hypothetical protein